jgi:hypothetical protein
MWGGRRPTSPQLLGVVFCLIILASTCETGVLGVTGVTVKSIYRSQVFDNSQQNSLRVRFLSSVLPLLCAARRTFIRAESPCTVAGLYPLTLSSGMERRVRAYRSALFVLGAPHIQSMLFPQRASAYLFLSAQAPIGPYSLSSARKRIPIVFFVS